MVGLNVTLVLKQDTKLQPLGQGAGYGAGRLFDDDSYIRTTFSVQRLGIITFQSNIGNQVSGIGDDDQVIATSVRQDGV